MRLALWVAMLLLPAATHAQRPGAQAGAPVLTEFRVFKGTQEVTATTRVRVTQAGKPGAAPIDVRGRVVELAPGIYDVQAIRTTGGVGAVRSIERLAVMHYPDERGRHLEVINFEPGFGALQVRTSTGRIDPAMVSLFPAGSRASAMRPTVAAPDYVLFVAPAGQYDVRVQSGDATEARWLLAIDLPGDRTRLKLVDVP